MQLVLPDGHTVELTPAQARAVVLDLTNQLSANDGSDRLIIDKSYLRKVLDLQFSAEPKRAKVRTGNLWGLMCELRRGTPFTLRCRACGGSVNNAWHSPEHKDQMELTAHALLEGRAAFVNSGRRLLGTETQRDFKTLCDYVEAELQQG